MIDIKKTKKQLIEELVELRQQLVKLKSSSQQGSDTAVSTIKSKERDRVGPFDILNSSPAVVFRWQDTEGLSVDFVSENAKNLFGYTASDFTTGKILYVDIIHPDDLDKLIQEIELYSNEKTINDFIHSPYRIITKTGEVKWIDDRTNIRRNKNGKVTHHQGILLDITSQKQAEKELSEAYNQLSQEQNLFVSGAVVVFKWRNEENWPVERVSPNVLDIFGYSDQEFLSGKVAYPTIIPKEDVERVADEVSVNSQSGAERFLHEPYRVVRKDGKVIWIEDHTTIVRNESGEITHYHGYVLDVTERKLAEDALKESEKRFKGLVEQSPLSIQVLTPDGITIQVNKAWEQLWGVTIENLKDYSILEDKQFESLGILPYIKRGFAGEHVTIPVVQYDPIESVEAGTKRWVGARIYPVRGEDGAIRNIILMHEDITKRMEAESALIESEDRFKAITNQASEGIGVADLDGNYTFVNPAFCEMLGYSEKELLQMTVFDVKTKDQDNSYFEKMKTSKEGQLTQVKLQRKDGTEFISEIVGTVIEISDKKFVLGTVTDITERKQAEDELRESRRQLLQAQFIAKIGDFTWDLTTNAVIWSDGMHKLLKYDKDEIIDYEKINVDVHHPDDLGRVTKWFMDSIASGKEVLTPNEYRLVCQDGEIINIQTIGQIEYRDGKAVKLFGICQDITKRKQAEEALRESEAKFRRYISAAPDAIFVVDAQGQYIEINQAACELTGYPESELITMSIPDILAPGASKIGLVNFEQLKKTGTSKEEFQLKRKDGSIIWSSLDAVALSENRFMAFCSDITETKRLQELESRASRLELAGTIAGQVAHDFNNLLAPIVAYPEFIHNELKHDSQAHAYLDAIEEAADKIVNINQDLLTMGRRGHYNQEVINLNRVVLQATKEMELSSDTVSCDLILCEDLMKVKGGPAQINRMLTNLLVNARDAIEDIGQINIKTENYYADGTSIAFGRVPKGEYVKITITDNGCGIPEKITQNILDPFFTTKTTDKKRGSGLGLSVVDAVMKDHHGYLDLTSKVGHGTSFYLYFPTTGEDSQVPDTIPFEGGEESILVVDDDRIQRNVTESLLSKFGYNVTVAESGEHAIELISKKQYDLLVLDMVMPGGIDGTETFRRILNVCPDQKAIILSGFSESDKVLETQKMGAGTFVKKPVTKTILAHAVRTELDWEKNRSN